MLGVFPISNQGPRMHSLYEEMKIKTKTMENGKCPQANLSIEYEKKKVIIIRRIENSFKIKK